MPSTSRPRRGSLAYSPRKRASSQVPRYNSWPEYEGEPVLQGFAGYKVGMTHIIMVDDHKHSPTEGKDIMVPVTIVEIPPMKVVGIRAYNADTYGKHACAEAWTNKCDEALSGRLPLPKKDNAEDALNRLRTLAEESKIVEVFALVHTQPAKLTGVPKKVPDLMEVRVAGGSSADRVEFAASLLGNEVNVENVVKSGQYVDVTAITRGKGTQGPVKRWGIQVRKGKHSRGGKKRHIGNLGPWTPHHVRWQVPQIGQTGYQQRTEFNKRILKISENDEGINPDGGFLHYGLVRNRYVMIKGSIPGPNKRLIRMRPAIRQREHVERTPAIEYVSVASKQG
jgi:large subunit ribosomal protein L3